MATGVRPRPKPCSPRPAISQPRPRGSAASRPPSVTSPRTTSTTVRRFGPSESLPTTGVATAPTSSVIVSAHWACGSVAPVEDAIAGTSGAPRLLITATTVPMKIRTGTSARSERGATTPPASQSGPRTGRVPAEALVTPAGPGSAGPLSSRRGRHGVVRTVRRVLLHGVGDERGRRPAGALRRRARRELGEERRIGVAPLGLDVGEQRLQVGAQLRAAGLAEGPEVGHLLLELLEVPLAAGARGRRPHLGGRLLGGLQDRPGGLAGLPGHLLVLDAGVVRHLAAELLRLGDVVVRGLLRAGEDAHGLVARRLGDHDAVDLRLQRAHLVAERGLLRVQPAELLGDPAEHPVHLGVDVAGAQHGRAGEPHVLQVRRREPAVGRGRFVLVRGHSVTSPSTLGPGRLGAKTSLEIRWVGTPLCTRRPTVSSTITAGPATQTWRLFHGPWRMTTSPMSPCSRPEILSSETAKVTVSQGCSCSSRCRSARS